MKDLLEKLSSYNLFNYLFPGILFAVMVDRLTSYHLLLDNIVIGVFVYYFYGLVISRIGSLLIEPFLKWIHVVNFASYSDFINASKSDSKIELLSEANNMYRTLISVFFCLLFFMTVESIEKKLLFISKYSPLIAVIFLLVIFILSFRKQTSYIRSRISHCNHKEKV